MDYPKILGVNRDIVIGCIAGTMLFSLLGLSLFTHAQLGEEPPYNISQADRAACELAKWETNASYQWNTSTETCEKQPELNEVGRSGG